MRINNTNKVFKNKNNLLRYIKTHSKDPMYPTVVNFSSDQEEEYKFLMRTLTNTEGENHPISFELWSELFGRVVINVGKDVEHIYHKAPKKVKRYATNAKIVIAGSIGKLIDL